MELNFRGGSFFGNSTSATLANSVFQIGSSTINPGPQDAELAALGFYPELYPVPDAETSKPYSPCFFAGRHRPASPDYQ